MSKNISIIENNILASNTIRRQLVISLQEKGYNVTILTTGSPEEIQEARERRFHIIDVKSSKKNIFQVFNYMKNLKTALKSARPDLVLTFTIRPAIWGNFVCRYLHLPVITNITGTGPLFSSEKFSYSIARKLYKAALKKTRWIFFQNEDDRELFLNHKYVQKSRSQIIPGSGVDTGYFLPGKRSGNHPFTFLFIGRLLKDKGVVEYIEAAQHLKRNLSHIIFKLAGPLWHQNLKSNAISGETLSHWMEEGIVDYKGKISDIRALIETVDCVVLPSYREGMSNVLLEASSMERPCITCNVTGCKEIVEDGVTGFLCEVRNIESLADKMLKMALLPIDKRREMGRAARQKVVKEFDKKIVIDAYLYKIGEILNS